MRRLAVAAALSLLGLVTTVVVYGFYPLPTTAWTWTDATLWLAIGLLALGLVCFVVLIVTGLILLLNWNSGARGSQGREP